MHLRLVCGSARYVVSLNVSTSREMYAPTLKAVSTTTTLPLVRNLSHMSTKRPKLFPIGIFSPLPAEPIVTYLTEELLIALHTSVEGYCEHACTIHRKKSTSCHVSLERRHTQRSGILTYTVEFACKDLEDDQSKAELTQTRSYVSSLKCSLSCSDLNQLLRRQHYRASSMQP